MIGKKLISNTTYLFLSWFSLTIISFLFWLVASKTLSPNEYGILATSLNFILLISNISLLGINMVLPKLVPQFEKKNIDYVHSLIIFSSKLIFSFLLIISVIFLTISGVFSNFLKIPSGIFLISVFSIISVSIYNFFGIILYSFQRMKHLFITDLFASLLKLLIPVFLLYFGYHYSGFLLGFLMSYSIFLFFRFDKNYFRHSNKKISYKQFFSYSVPALISFTTYYFLTYSPYLILPILQNIEISGVFALAFTVSSIFYVLSGVFTSALFPTTSELSTNHATKTRQGYFVTLTLRYILLVTLPAAFIFILFPDYIVLLFAKPAFLASTIYLQILVPAFLFFGIGSFFLSTIYGLGKPKIFRNIMIMTSLLFLVTSVLLTKYFSALGLSVTYFFTMLLCLSLSFNFLRKYTKIKIPSSDIAKILVASSFVMLLLFLSRSIISKLAIFILVLIPATLLYFLILLVLKFYRMEDIRVLEFFGRRVPFFGRYFLMISKFLKNKI